MALVAKLTQANESTWVHLGSFAEQLHDTDKAAFSFENALRHNPYNVKALTSLSQIYRQKESYGKAVEYLQRLLNIENTNGEIWGALGYCYLMLDDLQKAYTAYQQALYHLPNPKDPMLWYGIGILYDRYGSLEHAEEAFTAVLKMDPKFEKSNEIFFRLGVIYKQQGKYDLSLESFKTIAKNPPRPLVQGDIWFQIGHVHELQKDFAAAKDAYERVLKENPYHGKVLQQLGWLFHHNTALGNQETAIAYLTRSIDAEPGDAQTWYLLGRCYMSLNKYRKAYDAYQQAVYRDSTNPTFWCSIGVLYYQINQYRDALDAYSRAIRLNPYLSEVWYDLGTLYESCNQLSDSLDAYTRAAELDPNNKHIQQRLTFLRTQIQQQREQASQPAPAAAAPASAPSASTPVAPAPPQPSVAAGPAAEKGAELGPVQVKAEKAGEPKQALSGVQEGNSPDSPIPSLSELVKATDDPRHTLQNKAQGPPGPAPPSASSAPASASSTASTSTVSTSTSAATSAATSASTSTSASVTAAAPAATPVSASTPAPPSTSSPAVPASAPKPSEAKTDGKSESTKRSRDDESSSGTGGAEGGTGMQVDEDDTEPPKTASK